jgi:serine/threonine protein kinase
VVHRDVRPANILLDRSDAPHLTGFDLALLTDRDWSSPDLVGGTSAYAAPEQIDGEHIGPAVDVYAMGLVLLDCLTGTAEYSDAATLKPDVTGYQGIPAGPAGELANLLTTMIAHDPGRRPSAALCARTLLALAADESLPVPERSEPAAIASGPVEIVPGYADMDRPVPGTDSTTRRQPAPAMTSRAHRPLALVAAAAAITAATALMLVSLTHSADDRPGGPVASSPRSTHGTARTHPTPPTATGVRVARVATPHGTLLALPVTGNQSIADIQRIPESGPPQAPSSMPSPAESTTTGPVPTTAPGPPSTSTPPTTIPPAPSSN